MNTLFYNTNYNVALKGNGTIPTGACVRQIHVMLYCGCVTYMYVCAPHACNVL